MPDSAIAGLYGWSSLPEWPYCFSLVNLHFQDYLWGGTSFYMFLFLSFLWNSYSCNLCKFYNELFGFIDFVAVLYLLLFVILFLVTHITNVLQLVTCWINLFIVLFKCTYLNFNVAILTILFLCGLWVLWSWIRDRFALYL